MRLNKMDKDYDILIDENSKHKGFYVFNKPRMFKCDDRRNAKYKKFKRQNGFTPDETWSLCTSIAVFVLPRLKYFRENTCGYSPPFKTLKAWQKVLDKMIFSFENIIKYNGFGDFPEEYLVKYKNNKDAMFAYYKDLSNGFKLFGKYFGKLWW